MQLIFGSNIIQFLVIFEINIIQFLPINIFKFFLQYGNP